jgi:hypothetical protein
MLSQCPATGSIIWTPERRGDEEQKTLFKDSGESFNLPAKKPPIFMELTQHSLLVKLGERKNIT